MVYRALTPLGQDRGQWVGADPESRADGTGLLTDIEILRPMSENVDGIEP